MGLRMFVDPDTDGCKGPLKADPTATARSAIRRQRIIRHGPPARVFRPDGNGHDSHRLVQNQQSGGLRFDRSTLLEDIRRRGRDAIPQTSHVSHRNDMQSSEPPATQSSHSVEHAVLRTGGQATHRSRVEVEAMQESRNRDWAESFTFRREEPREDRSRTPQEIAPSLVRPTSSQARTLVSQSERNQVYGANISPEPASRSSLRRFRRRAAYTPGFAPAHRLTSSGSDMAYTQRVLDIATLSNQIRALQTLPQHPEDAYELSAMLQEVNTMLARRNVELSPRYLDSENEWIDVMREEINSIRCRTVGGSEVQAQRPYAGQNGVVAGRLSNLSGASDSPRDDSDGLGDRQRSLSPETVSWETMLTTITPDDQIPSVHSSFASTGASGSAASSFVESSSSFASTAASTAPGEDPCPNIEVGEAISNLDERPSTGEASETMRSIADSGARALNTVGHLDRIESLTTRLQRQRSQGEFFDRHRRIVEREAELQRLEMTLRRLERQLEGERESGIGIPQRRSSSRARERL